LVLEENIGLLRGVLFVTMIASMFIWESIAPRKTLTQSRLFRWCNNLGLVALNNIVIMIVVPLVAYEAAIISHEYHSGLFNWLGFGLALNILVSVLVLDFIIYMQHQVFHKVSFFWRLHRVHHADQDIDVTTGTRFHPLEIILSMFIKVGAVFILGVSPVAIVVFEILLNVSALFNHSNIQLPSKIDHQLRKWIVTPDMHRVHHSVHRNETDSNFGFFLSIWDRVLKTYISQPVDGHENMKIGINLFEGKIEQRIDKMLTQPFRKK
jgi:sterol desaturase/sphingolipid hydroxylase (fatty acid hydroxylase superfamily)